MRRLPLLSWWCFVGVSVGVAVAKPQQPRLQVDVTKAAICPLAQKAAAGDKVTVHYGGFLMDGKKFDSSFDRSKPFTFDLGVGQVIPGWDQGLIGVCKGEERHLVVPSSLAYGERGAGEVIPPHATLLFDIVIVDVEKVRSAEDIRREQEEEEQRRRKQQEEEEAARRRAAAAEEERKRAAAAAEARRRAEEAEAARRRQQQEDERRRQQQIEADRQRQQQQQPQQQQHHDYEYEDYPTDSSSSCPAGQLDTRIQYRPPDCVRQAQAGDKLRMHYVGKLLDGTKFDSSIDRNKPFDFTLGVGQVIQGWDAGVAGMCVSEKRTLVVPADMAYGEAGVGNVIPSCATLVFDVLLLSIDS